MTDIEMMEAMKTILQPIKNKLDDMDIKLDTLQLNAKTSERAIRKDIHYLNDEVLYSLSQATWITKEIQES